MRVVTELRIQLMENGQVAVAGPLGDRLRCYGMLESARDAVRDFDPAKAQPQPRIVVPTPRVNGNGPLAH